MTQPTHVSKSDSSGTIFSLLPDNTQHLASLQGHLDGNLRIIEQRLQLSISNRGNRFHLDGTP
nr:PhoH family protein [Oceanospirillaceae bacterium]